MDGIAGGGGEGETFGGGGDSIDSGAGAGADSGSFSGSGETIDDGLGGVCGGEHPAVGFGFEVDTVALEPFDGVARAEVVKRSEERFFATGVIFY